MKLMYLARRNPSYASSEAFQPRWRQHGHLAMSLPTWKRAGRYLHADALDPSPVGEAHDYDGVGVTWRESFPIGAGKPQHSTPTGRILLEDELLAFDGPVLPRAFFVDESVLVSTCGSDLTAYLFFEGGAAAEAGAETLAATAADRPGRVVLNRVSDDGPVPEPTYTYQGIVEVFAPDRAGLDALVVAGWQGGVRPDLEVVTRQVLLWDDGPVEGSGAPA